MTDPKAPPNVVNIRPGVSVLSVLRHLNYKPWFALAEFVDNSIQSYLSNVERIRSADAREIPLAISIEIVPTDGGVMTIRDNAAGISEKDYPRAFRAAQLPPDTTGLAEFGMGMKSAACWFSPHWSVRTSALGEPTEKSVTFEINRIVRDELEELEIDIRPAEPGAHFTEIRLERLYRVPVGKTLQKLQDHLSEIYRVFMRERTVSITLNGGELAYREPQVLVSPTYDENFEPVGDPKEWRKEIRDFDLGGGLKLSGFAALRHEGSTTHAGFSLFRRNRLIVGSADEKYRPQKVFGAPNDYVFQRLFGELHLQGFEVTHTKDGFNWDDTEEPFLDLLKEWLDSEPLPLIRQARNYRARTARRDLRNAAEQASERTSRALEQYGPVALAEIRDAETQTTPPTELPATELAAKRVIDIEFEGRRWRIVIELSDDMALTDRWLELSESVVQGAASDGRELLGVRLSLEHPFTKRFAGADADKIEPLLRLGAAICLAEKSARDGGLAQAGAVRLKLNKLLRDALSRR